MLFGVSFDNITTMGMNGMITFEESLSKRIKHIEGAHRSDFERCCILQEDVVTGLDALIDHCIASCIQVYVVSGYDSFVHHLMNNKWVQVLARSLHGTRLDTDSKRAHPVQRLCL